MPWSKTSWWWTTLIARWSKRDNDMLYHRPANHDGGWLHSWLEHIHGFTGKTFIEELKERGYDVTTLRVSVKKDPTHPRWNKT